MRVRHIFLILASTAAAVCCPIVAYYTPGDWWPDESRDPDPPRQYYYWSSQDSRGWRNDSLMQADGWINSTSALPRYGYPLRPATFRGLNDTVQVFVQFDNRTGEDYVFGDSRPEYWWGPRVYDDFDLISTAEFVADSTTLGYRIRGWRPGGNQSDSMQSAPDTIHGDVSAYDTPYMVMDVWDLPAGLHRLVLIANSSVPVNAVRNRAL